MNACSIPQSAKGTPNSIHVPLHEHEAAAEEFSSWPPAVQNIHTRELELWAQRNPGLDVTGQTHSIDVVRRVTVTEFYPAPKVTT